MLVKEVMWGCLIPVTSMFLSSPGDYCLSPKRVRFGKWDR